MLPRDNAFAVISQQGFEAARDRLVSRINRTTDDGCWEYSGYTVNGYGRLRIGNTRILAHRAAWVIANRADPGELFVCHSCDNRLCCNPAHLFLGTALDNSRDMHAKGRRSPQSGPRKRVRGKRLTALQAAAIRQDRRPLAAISADYGISRGYASDVRRGRCWVRPVSDDETLFHVSQNITGGQPNHVAK
jgi:hypothetical protein